MVWNREAPDSYTIIYIQKIHGAWSGTIPPTESPFGMSGLRRPVYLN